MSFVRSRLRLIAVGVPLLLVTLSALLLLVGKSGPTLLWWSNMYAPEWRGLGQLPAESWRTLTEPGAAVYSDHPYGFYWTEVAADEGDFMIAVGPEGLAFASASDVTANWEGIMRSRALIPHSWLLGAAGAMLILALGVLCALGKRKSGSQLPVDCETCV